MPGAAENPPKRYARLIARELVAIAALHNRTSGRKLADWLGFTEKYVRDRVGPNATKSFTVTDVETFARLARLDPAEFLGDPTAVRKAEQAKPRTNVVRGRFGVAGQRQDLERAALDSTRIAASKDATPVDPARGEK